MFLLALRSSSYREFARKGDYSAGGECRKHACGGGKCVTRRNSSEVTKNGREIAMQCAWLSRMQALRETQKTATSGRLAPALNYGSGKQCIASVGGANPFIGWYGQALPCIASSTTGRVRCGANISMKSYV
jgi:hypothetical protein